MPSSNRRDRKRIVEGPETPTGQVVPDVFGITGGCVIERILGVVRDSLPELPKREREIVGLAPGSVFVGHQNAAEESKQYPVEVAIKVF